MSGAMPSARAGAASAAEPLSSRVSGQAAIPIAQDINLSAIMRAENIAAIKTWPAGYFSVELNDGWFGTGRSVGEALAKAKSRAENVRRVA